MIIWYYGIVLLIKTRDSGNLTGVWGKKLFESDENRNRWAKSERVFLSPRPLIAFSHESNIKIYRSFPIINYKFSIVLSKSNHHLRSQRRSCQWEVSLRRQRNAFDTSLCSCSRTTILAILEEKRISSFSFRNSLYWRSDSLLFHDQ